MRPQDATNGGQLQAGDKKRKKIMLGPQTISKNTAYWSGSATELTIFRRQQCMVHAAERFLLPNGVNFYGHGVEPPDTVQSSQSTTECCIVTENHYNHDKHEVCGHLQDASAVLFGTM